MKIFSASQIRACDAYTIHATRITSTELMERAAMVCCHWFTQHFGLDTLFVVLCGPGNNGGDGLAISRLLNSMGYGVKSFLIQFSEQLSTDCEANFKRLQLLDQQMVQVLQPGSFITDIPESIVIIDSLLGTGLSRPTQGWVAEFIEHINGLNNRKIAIDIPSGLPSDGIPEAGAAIMHCTDTLSFQFYKRSFLHPETSSYVGNIHILDINLHHVFIESTPSQYYFIELSDLKEFYKPRKPFAHKGNFGHALLIGGSYGKMGAICLSAKAALTSGCGLLTAMIPNCGYSIMQTYLPEAMCICKGDSFISEIEGWENYSAIGIGMGMAQEAITAKAFADFIDKYKKPLVIDADGLNLLANQPELLHALPAGTILTPHPKEFERLFGKSKNSMMQLEMARAQAMKYNVYIVLKGHHTIIVAPDGECRYNSTGNVGMAKGGSGDVLSGILTALLAQGYTPREAALMGVYLHGLAGDCSSQNKAFESMLASDIIKGISAAFKILAT
jgi:NAD(P)H-hydrate epimerase